jgi:hypothetical protein
MNLRFKKLIKVALVTLAIVFGAGTVATSDGLLPHKYLLTEQHKRYYRDYTKKFDGVDDMMCWAIALANVMAFISNETPDEYFEEFLPYRTGRGNTAVWAIEELCHDVGPNTDIRYCKLYQEGVSFFADQTNNIVREIVTLLLQNHVIYLAISGSWGGHAINVYGYEIADNGDIFLYVVDGDDGKRFMYKAKVELLITMFGEAYWGFTEGRFAGWALDEIAAFPIKPRSLFSAKDYLEDYTGRTNVYDLLESVEYSPVEEEE